MPLEQLEPWRAFLGAFFDPGAGPLLDIGAGTGLWTRALVTWFDAEVVALEPSSGMREVGVEIGLPSRACYVAASAEHLPFGRAAFGAAWLSTVVHHLTDLSACARELRRALSEGASVMIRNSFPGRLEEVELFRHFPAAAAVAAHWPTLEHVVATFAEAGFNRQPRRHRARGKLAKPGGSTRLGSGDEKHRLRPRTDLRCRVCRRTEEPRGGDRSRRTAPSDGHGSRRPDLARRPVGNGDSRH